MKTPFLSVIVPVYKVEAYLAKCIESILHQSLGDFELILIDDGSPDNSPTICDDYARRDARVRVIHKKNGGSSSARNVGIDAAVGEYILFMDSDDYYNDLELFSLLKQRKDSYHEDLILFGCKIVKENGEEEVTRSNYDFAILNQHEKSASLDSLYAANNFPGAAWIYILKRDIVESHQMRFTEGVTGEDFEWIVSSLIYSNAIGAIDGVHYAYIKREGSVTSQAKLSGFYGTVNAYRKYQELGVFYPALDKFLARIYFLAVMSYRNLPPSDKAAARKLLSTHMDMVKIPSCRAQYLFMKLFGFHLSSSIINFIYSIIR